MIRRVLSQPGPSALGVAALPPGTPVNGPLRVVYVSDDGTSMGQDRAHPVVAADGSPHIQTGLTNWGTLAAAGRLW